VPGPGVDALLDKISPPGRGVLQVSVASTPGAQPAGFPASLIGGSSRTPWTADTASPVLHLSWHGQRRIASLIVRPAAGLPSTPLTVKVTSPAGTRRARIGPGGLVRFTPLTTDRIDVSFPGVRQATIVTLTGQLEALPVRLSRLSVPALAGLRAVSPDERARFIVACGHGPALTVDGRVYQTAVSGTIGELSQYLPLPVRLCSPGGTLSLGAGRHTLTAAAPGTFVVTDLSLTSTTPAPSTATASGASRAVTIRSWQPDQRRLGIGPGVASYLEVHENYNPGWAAALNGQQLAPVRLDGWQQGFIVPSGPGGTITLSFRPAATYHLALAASILAAAFLLAVAAWSFTRPREPKGAGPAWTEERGPSDEGRRGLKGRPEASGTTLLGLLAVVALIFVAGGPVVLAVPLLACLAWLLPRPAGGTAAHDPPAWVPWLAFGGLVASGLLSAVRPFGDGLFGPFGWPAQACALVALAAALRPAVAVPVWRRRSGREAAAPARPTEKEDR